MKKALLLLFVAIISTASYAQEDLVVDQSLMVRILDVTNKGYISKRDLPKAEKLELNEKDGKIISFMFSYMLDDKTIVEIKNQGPQFSEQIKTRLSEMSIGKKFYIENVVVDNASGRVTTRPATFTVKS